MPNLGIAEMVVLLFIVLLLFGAKRLPEVGASLGKGLRNFKDSVSGGGGAKPEVPGKESSESK